MCPWLCDRDLPASAAGAAERCVPHGGVNPLALRGETALSSHMDDSLIQYVAVRECPM
jgi:hypothetical protein